LLKEQNLDFTKIIFKLIEAIEIHYQVNKF